MVEDLYVREDRRWVQCGDRSVPDVNFVNENE
jgi:hypothetical protein